MGNRNTSDVEKLLREGKTVQFHPKGNSMFPLFVSESDYAIAEPFSGMTKRGDVLVYRRKGGILVIHRVYKRTDDKFYFVGDRQTEIEGPIMREQICGVMTAFIRKGKEYRTDNPGYIMLSKMWLILRPFRKIIFGICHFIKIAMYKIARKPISKWN